MGRGFTVPFALPEALVRLRAVPGGKIGQHAAPFLAGHQQVFPHIHVQAVYPRRRLNTGAGGEEQPRPHRRETHGKRPQAAPHAGLVT